MSDRYVFQGVNEAVVIPTLPPSTIGNGFVAGVYAEWFRGEMGMVVIDRNSKQVVDVRYLSERDPLDRKQEIFSAYRSWFIRTIWCSQPGLGDYLLQQWQMDGLPVRGFKMTDLSRRNVIESLAAAIEKQEIGLPDDERLLGDLHGYQVDLSPDLKYIPRAGGTPVRVMALAIAWYGLTHSGWLVDFA